PYIYTLALHDALPIFDGGNTYDIVLNTDQGDNLTSGNNSGFTVTSISNCNTNNNGQHPHTDPLQFTSIDLSDYIGTSGLRIRFVDRKSTRLNSSHVKI